MARPPPEIARVAIIVGGSRVYCDGISNYDHINVDAIRPGDDATESSGVALLHHFCDR